MREFLEDALKHQDAGAGRQQRDRLVELPKRFYDSVDVKEESGVYTVTLNNRVTKTPTGRPITTTNVELASYMRHEWEAQGELIDPDTMPHVKLVNSAVEGGEEAQPALVEEIVKYAGNDLLLYRADHPRELVERQEEVWDDILVRLARHFSVSFQPTVGIIHQEQSPEMLATLKASLAGLHHIPATAMVSLTGLTGSGLLAIAIREKLIDRDTAWTAAHVDEDYQISLWGEDFEASERRKQRRKEYDAAANVIKLLA